MNRSWALPLSLALALPVAPSRAQDSASAQALFEEGRGLAQKGNCAEAIPKFVASHKLDPSPGPLLNLADCYEKTGRSASAWARFVEAAGLAKNMGQPDREAFARKRAAALLPKLARLTLVVDAPPAGLRVERDGVTIEAGAFGSALPIDPGVHVLTAHAPGKRPLRVEISVEKEKSTTFVLPPLEDEPAPAAPPAPAAVPAQPAAPAPLRPASPPLASPGPQRTIGIVATTAGAVALGVGATFGLVARSRYVDLEERCPNGVCESPADLARVGDVKSAARLSDWFFAGGALLVTTGIVVWLTAPSDHAPSLGLSASPGGATLIGSF